MRTLLVLLSLSMLLPVRPVDAARCGRVRSHRPVTIVRGHYNPATGTSTRSHYRRSHVIHSSTHGPHWVKGYRRRDGTYVEPHWSRPPGTAAWPIFRPDPVRPPTLTVTPPSWTPKPRRHRRPSMTPSMPSSPQPPSTSTPPPSDGTVWVDTKSGIFHQPGTRWYGRTKQGEYMPEADAIAKGFRPSRSEH